jgi:hypothetical protein
MEIRSTSLGRATFCEIGQVGEESERTVNTPV